MDAALPSRMGKPCSKPQLAHVGAGFLPRLRPPPGQRPRAVRPRELTWILGTPPRDGKPFQRANRQAVHSAIATAVKHGFLDGGSCLECLVVPGHAIQGPQGKADAPCPVHERKYREKRAKLKLVS